MKRETGRREIVCANISHAGPKISLTLHDYLALKHCSDSHKIIFIWLHMSVKEIY